jgi:anaerobic magnesium-protoporphyrin IX monomethyl ester cyclase
LSLGFAVYGKKGRITVLNDIMQELKQLDKDILAFIQKGVAHDDEKGFNDLAMRAFELQFNSIPLYRRYCQRREITPQEISSWDQIPPLPTDVFKEAVFSLLPDQIARTFTTSGTSNIKEQGNVSYDEGGLNLMDTTIRTAASAMLFPDGVRPVILVLAPPPEIAPQMVMVYGMNRLIEYFGLPQSRFLIEEIGFDIKSLIDSLRTAEKEGVPVAICGGSFGFVNFFDYCDSNGITFHLPAGSRCLDAGGFKGRSREVGRGEFLNLCEDILDVQKDRCVNLLGMTEISSQYYDNTMKSDQGIAKAIPPWTRVLVVDPDSLAPLPAGETGLLRHFDLANRGHICAIQTDDLGKIVPGGFEVYGRARDDGSRGCSLSIDEMTRIIKEGP